MAIAYLIINDVHLSKSIWSQPVYWTITVPPWTSPTDTPIPTSEATNVTSGANIDGGQILMYILRIGVISWLSIAIYSTFQSRKISKESKNTKDNGEDHF